ncbi:uncharacterized protein METZ01_LOCUS417927 [marine metagenome]|uniref:Uncharacterized protein n=1 Tax=marine metagenome TaxID=408172 RepID=A0A382X276_9ZZZZ
MKRLLTLLILTGLLFGQDTLLCPPKNLMVIDGDEQNILYWSTPSFNPVQAGEYMQTKKMVLLK